MNRLQRLLRFPRALAGALRRNGARNVWRFAKGMTVRHGLRGMASYALTPQGARRDRVVQLEVAQEQREARALVEATDLDASWTAAEDRWLSLENTTTSPAQTTIPSGIVHIVSLDSAPPLAPPGAADGDWVLLLDPGDRPAQDAGFHISKAGGEACVEVVSFDLVARRQERRVLPVLAPGANPWLARYADVGFGRYAARVGALRRHSADTPHAWLRAWLAARSLNEAGDRWRHVSRPLVEVDLPPETIADQRALARARADAELRPVDEAPEGVSIIICTHERTRLLRQLVRALDGDPRIREVVVVANNSHSEAARDMLAWLEGRDRVVTLVIDGPFNFSRLSNAGAALTRGDRLLFMNDDVTPVSDDWLEPLLAPLRNPDVGIAGPLLLYPDDRVQHAGMYLGFRGHAGHTFRGLKLPDEDYLFYGGVPRQVSAVTGAVMMVERRLFEALNGFDELLPTFLQDVDLCLRARAVGRASVWTPLAELLHFESLSLGVHVHDPEFQAQRGRESERFLQRWGQEVAHDPFHNPNFDLGDERLKTLAD